MSMENLKRRNSAYFQSKDVIDKSEFFSDEERDQFTKAWQSLGTKLDTSKLNPKDPLNAGALKYGYNTSASSGVVTEFLNQVNKRVGDLKREAEEKKLVLKEMADVQQQNVNTRLQQNRLTSYLGAVQARDVLNGGT